MSLGPLRLDALARAERLTLLLDLDGTLIPFAPTPELALLDEDGAELLRAIVASGIRIAVVSGRTRQLVEPIRLAVSGLLCVAEHGAWRHDGERWQCRGEGMADINTLSEQLGDLAASTPGARLERKSLSVALHWRLVSDADRVAFHAVVDALVDDWLVSRPDHRRLSGVDMLEILPRTTHKGHAVAWVRERVGGSRFIAIGDDLTDEDMFAALDAEDLSIAVGDAERPTRAHARLDGVGGVRDFLRWLLQARLSAANEEAPAFLHALENPRRTGFLVISNRIPRIVSDGPREVGGLVSALEPALRNRDGLWLGWSGQERDAPVEICYEAHANPARISFDLSPELRRLYYAGFCNRVLWPLLHGFPGRLSYDDDEWEAYVACNDVYADLAQRVVAPDGVVWLHDYHVLLAGAALRRRGHTGRLALFLHVPFPPSSVFATLPWAREVLEAMSAFDLVGFQCHRWAHNFIEARSAWPSATASAVGVFPVGIDPERFACREPLIQPEVARLITSLGDRRLLLGVDRLDYAKGVTQRLEAFERLLERDARWRRGVTLLQISVPSRSDVAEYVELRQRVEHQVGRINGRFGEADWVPVRYLYRAYDQVTLAQLYRAADVALVTPLCDGMNLVAKEFVAAQDPDDPGVLVLSRFAGAADQLAAAVLTNPFHRDGLANDLARALSMGLEERVARHRELLAGVTTSTASRWASDVLAALERRAA